MTSKRRPIAYVDGSITRRPWVAFGRRVTGHHRNEMTIIIILTLDIVLLIINNIALRMCGSCSVVAGGSLRNDFLKTVNGLQKKNDERLYIDYQGPVDWLTDWRPQRRATSEREERYYITTARSVDTLATLHGTHSTVWWSAQTGGNWQS